MYFFYILRSQTFLLAKFYHYLIIQVYKKKKSSLQSRFAFIMKEQFISELSFIILYLILASHEIN